MGPKGKDALIEEIDKELRSIDARLKRILSKTDALLKGSANGRGEAANGDNNEKD